MNINYSNCLNFVTCYLVGIELNYYSTSTSRSPSHKKEWAIAGYLMCVGRGFLETRPKNQQFNFPLKWHKVQVVCGLF